MIERFPDVQLSDQQRDPPFSGEFGRPIYHKGARVRVAARDEGRLNRQEGEQRERPHPEVANELPHRAEARDRPKLGEGGSTNELRGKRSHGFAPITWKVEFGATARKVKCKFVLENLREDLKNLSSYPVKAAFVELELSNRFVKTASCDEWFAVVNVEIAPKRDPMLTLRIGEFFFLLQKPKICQ